MVLSGQHVRDEALMALAQQVQTGDRAAFALLVERLQRPLYRFLLVRTGDAHDAEELTQEAFARAWAARARYDGRHAYATWLFTIGRRLAISHHRRRVRADCDPLPDDMDSGELEPGVAAGHAEERDNLWALAARVLGDEARSALWLRYVEGQTPAQIGAVLGRSGPGVRVLLFRARRALGKCVPDPETAARSTVPAVDHRDLPAPNMPPSSEACTGGAT